MVFADPEELWIKEIDIQKLIKISIEIKNKSDICWWEQLLEKDVGRKAYCSKSS